MASFYRETKEAHDEALYQFSKALELDPDFATAYGMAGWCYAARKINRWTADGAQEHAEGARLARRAADLGKDDAVALARAGHALALLIGDVDGGISLVDRALALNPNLAAAWFLGGFLHVFRGESDVAIEHLTRAMRLSPLDPEMFRMQTGTAFAHLFAGRLDDASSWAEKSLRHLPNYLAAACIAAASHALAGRMDEARRAMQHLRKLDPELRVSNLKDWIPIRHPEHFAIWTAGLRKAGLPE